MASVTREETLADTQTVEVPYPLAKRVFDRVVAAILVFAATPLLLVAVLLLGL
jgi:lipopolysaccharide/colanic/teichoic acid biosynthesis glycosyltransferase